MSSIKATAGKRSCKWEIKAQSMASFLCPFYRDRLMVFRGRLALVPSLKADLHWFIWKVSKVDEAARSRKWLMTWSILLGTGSESEATP